MTYKAEVPWTADEINRLTETYPVVWLARDLLPQFPGRSINQLRCKARHLGLKRLGTVGTREALPLTVAQAAYMAGLIDGEGTIAVNCYKTVSRVRGPQVTPWVGVFNTNTDLLDWLIKTTGLSGVQRMRKNPTKNSKMVYEWKVRATLDIVRLLRTVLPYLVIKRRQAELLIEFCETRVLYKPLTERGQAIINELRQLNKRGT